MEMLVIKGGRPLSGSVVISGSKNSALPILISTMLSKKVSTITNVPHLADTRFLVELLQSFGASCELSDNRATISCDHLTSFTAPYDVVRKMRASVLVLAPLLARTGQAIVSLPGGCAIGTRPVDIHLNGLMRMGAQIEVIDGYIHGKLTRGGFVGAEYEMPLPSVGATENLIMAAVLAHGRSVFYKVAKEPEVVELCRALTKAGAKINGIGSSTLEIDGVAELDGLSYQINPDRIEAGSFIAMASGTKSAITLKQVRIDELSNVMERFSAAGVKFNVVGDGDLVDLETQAPERLNAVDVETAAYPGFPTDMQAQFMAAMTIARGTSVIFERIFENRMMHVPELRRMGASIDVKNGIAKVSGREALRGAPVMATDLRASASLVIAALCAGGTSEIRRVYHLDRGYESLEKKLNQLGADIVRCQQ